MLDIIRATAAPYLIRVADRHLFISPPDFRGIATLLAYLSRHPGMIREYMRENDGNPPDRDWIPRLSSEVSIDILMDEGLALVIYVTTRRDHPNLSYEEIREISPLIEKDTDSLSLISLMTFIGRPEISRKGNGASRPYDPRGHVGIESRNFGEIMACPPMAKFSPTTIAAMSDEQGFNVLVEGKYEEGVSSPGRPLTAQQAVDYIAECHRAIAEGREVPECPS